MLIKPVQRITKYQLLLKVSCAGEPARQGPEGRAGDEHPQGDRRAGQVMLLKVRLRQPSPLSRGRRAGPVMSIGRGQRAGPVMLLKVRLCRPEPARQGPEGWAGDEHRQEDRRAEQLMSIGRGTGGLGR